MKSEKEVLTIRFRNTNIWPSATQKANIASIELKTSDSRKYINSIISNRRWKCVWNSKTNPTTGKYGLQKLMKILTNWNNSLETKRAELLCRTYPHILMWTLDNLHLKIILESWQTWYYRWLLRKLWTDHRSK